MSEQPLEMGIGVGPTEGWSLRVSVAALVKVVFVHPENSEVMLALERKATLLEARSGRIVEVSSRPFGGALRILDLEAFRKRIGDFHFDSEKSRREQDLRIFIDPSAWQRVRNFCLEQLSTSEQRVLESDPWRELTEEFNEALGIDLVSEQLGCRPVGSVLEETARPTGNAYARGFPTARMYRIFEARVLDRSLIQIMLSTHERVSNHALQEMALEDARRGGRGWANSILTLPLRQLSAHYASAARDLPDHPVTFEGHRLDETLAAILEEVTVPDYRRV